MPGRSQPPRFLFEEDRRAVELGQSRGEGAMAIIADRDGRVLLHLRDDNPSIWYPGHWAIFGGGVEPGEDPHDALHREIREELNIELHDPVPFCRVFDRDGSKQLVTVFVAIEDLDLAAIKLGEGLDAQLFEESETNALQITPFLHHALRAWFSERTRQDTR